MQIGPSGTVGKRLGGMDYRDRIYSFPVSSSCRVDQELVRDTFTDEGWVESAQFNVRGLDAIEYLLFGITETNTCPSVSGINRSGTWNAEFAQDSGELLSRRTRFATVLSEALAVDAAYLRDAWKDESGTFAYVLLKRETPIDSEETALDQIFAGIFYVDNCERFKLGSLPVSMLTAP